VSSLSRRALLTAAAGVAGTGWCEPAQALGRVPLGGTVTFRVPWPTRALDPHDLFDPLAALFATAIADPPYALDARGRPYPALADGMPTVEDGQTVVRLRPGLRSARGKAIGGRALAWSATRARNTGGAGMAAVLGPYVRSDPNDPLIARFGEVEPTKLAVLLASPLFAVLPVGFSPRAPDGTGAFRARCTANKLELTRNLNAARGPSYLERIVVHRARDLSDSLRNFEAGRDDIGWLGLGLHRNRAGARKFDFGVPAWVVLATGTRAGRFALPGVAQQLANAVPIERLGLGLGPRKGRGSGAAWMGEPASLLYLEGSGQLRAIAEAVAAKLSSKGHEIEPRAVSGSELRRRRRNGRYELAIDVVRDPATRPIDPLIALATADSKALGRDMARKPPRIRYGAPVHRYTTALRVGVLGGIVVRGGLVGSFKLAALPGKRGIDWGSSYRGA
jgi:peptide/nickel transport system substrate-binding protein